MVRDKFAAVSGLIERKSGRNNAAIIQFGDKLTSPGPWGTAPQTNQMVSSMFLTRRELAGAGGFEPPNDGIKIPWSTGTVADIGRHKRKR